MAAKGFRASKFKHMIGREMQASVRLFVCCSSPTSLFFFLPLSKRCGIVCTTAYCFAF